MLTLNVLISFILFFHSVKSIDYGTECQQSFCTQMRGYIQYRGYAAVSGSRWNIRTNNGDFTTFVLHLKNIENYDIRSRWLRIRQSNYRFEEIHDIRGIQERIFVFAETNEVTISIQAYNYFLFRLNFFIGCKLIEGSNITIEKEVSNQFPVLQTNLFGQIHKRIIPTPHINTPFNQRRQVHKPVTCWFVIPTIQEEFNAPINSYWEAYYRSLGIFIPTRKIKRNIEVQETIVSLQNVTTQNESGISVVNLINENTVLSTQDTEKEDIFIIEKSNITITYKTSQNISTLIFIDMNCTTNQECQQTTFKFTANALKQSDLDCMEREKKCRFNIGPRHFDCAPPEIPPWLILFNKTEEELSHTSCVATSLIFSRVNEQESTTIKDSLEGRKYKKCDSFKKYCSRKCGTFKRCARMCYVVKYQLRLCKSNISVFA